MLFSISCYFVFSYLLFLAILSEFINQTAINESGDLRAWFETKSGKLTSKFPQLATLPDLKAEKMKNRDKDGFLETIKSIDSSFKSPPATAQNAKQVKKPAIDKRPIY